MRVGSRFWQPCSRGLGVSLLIALGGCGPALSGEEGSELQTREDEIRIPNSLTTQALVFNALSTNKLANKMLGTRSLQQLFTPTGSNEYIQNQLWDPHAQQFMHYLVSCALATGQELPWSNPLTGTGEVWHGKLGLCPEWASTTPSMSCLERVSSCLLARNNAFGKRVELSVRGEHPTNPSVFHLEPVTRPTEFDPSTSLREASFSACTPGTLGVTRDCGWAVDAIGACTPGNTVRLGAGGQAPDLCTGATLGASTGARMMVRACEGIAGCDEGNERLLAQSEGSCGTLAPAVAFTCPATGYFSVMTAPYDSTQLGTATVEVSNATYNLSEAQVFGVREGAFYGTIFDPEALAAEIHVVKGRVIGRDQVVHGSVYRRMYSCYDSAWTNSSGASAHRVCALPSSGSNCAAKVTGACVMPGQRSFPSSMCEKDDGTQVVGDGDFEECRDNSGEQWNAPITVYLNGACDVVGDYDQPRLCGRK